MDIFEEIVRVRFEGGKAALATIVRRQGSTPRRDFAKMLICEDGSTIGSVGGGQTEADVLDEAKRVMETGNASLLKYQLTQKDAEKEGLSCGGTVEIFVEPILPDPKLILMGAGHIGQTVAQAVHRIGFKVAVVDDRESFANRERFPQADEIIVAPFQEGLNAITVSQTSFILIATRGHGHDQTVLEQALRTPACYIGMVGSRRKTQIIVENLLRKGVLPDALSHLYAPIGIDIGSETPEEIAVSVAAELIAILRGVHQRSEKQRFLMKILAKAQAEAEVKV
ncbi:MAG: XdhC family protein [Acidobacteriota bacterium]